MGKNTPIKNSPIPIQSNLSDNDDDYSYSYSSQEVNVVSPIIPKVVPKPKGSMSPMKPESPMRPNIMTNRNRPHISPQKTPVRPKKVVSSPIIELSDDDDYSYSCSKSD